MFASLALGEVVDIELDCVLCHSYGTKARSARAEYLSMYVCRVLHLLNAASMTQVPAPSNILDIEATKPRMYISNPCAHLDRVFSGVSGGVGDDLVGYPRYEKVVKQ